MPRVGRPEHTLPSGADKNTFLQGSGAWGGGRWVVGRRGGRGLDLRGLHLFGNIGEIDEL